MRPAARLARIASSNRLPPPPVPRRPALAPSGTGGVAAGGRVLRPGPSAAPTAGRAVAPAAVAAVVATRAAAPPAGTAGCRAVAAGAAARAVVPAGAAGQAARAVAPVAMAGATARRRQRRPAPRRPRLRPWPILLAVAGLVATIVLAGFGLRELVAELPMALVAAGLPRPLAVPVALSPVWAVIFAGVQLTLRRSEEETDDAGAGEVSRQHRRATPVRRTGAGSRAPLAAAAARGR